MTLRQCSLICGIFALNSALTQSNPEEILDCTRNLLEKPHTLLSGISLLVSLLTLDMIVPAI